jgi:hypothetical protein
MHAFVHNLSYKMFIMEPSVCSGLLVSKAENQGQHEHGHEGHISA